MNPIEANPGNIWEYPQNRPELVIRDLEKATGLDSWGRMVVSAILLARGVNKWLANRKKFIRLKHEIRKEITNLHQEMEKAKQDKNYVHRQYLRGRLSALVQVREDLRKICKSERWVGTF